MKKLNYLFIQVLKLLIIILYLINYLKLKLIIFILNNN